MRSAASVRRLVSGAVLGRGLAWRAGPLGLACGAALVAGAGLAAPVWAQPCVPSGWTLTVPPQGVPARSGAGVAEGPGGTVVLFGGSTVGGLLGDTWVRGVSDWSSPALAGVSPEARLAPGLAYDAQRGRTVLFGGIGNNGVLTDTWEWDGAAWTQRFPATSPPPRVGGTLVYAGNGRTLFFGGVSLSGDALIDTWIYDGTDWTDLGFTGLQQLRDAGAAFDASRGVVVLYGGLDPFTFLELDGTFEFNGTAWNPVSAGTLPGGRELPSVAYDAARQRVVLFGGLGTDRNTFELVGGVWTLAASNAPAPGLALAYHGGLGRVIQHQAEPGRTFTWDGAAWIVNGPVYLPAINLGASTLDPTLARPAFFGGSLAFGQTLNILWSLGPSGWFPIAEDGPSPRDSTALAGDTLRTRLVLFGGLDGDGLAQGDTWAWSGTAWAPQGGPQPPARFGHAMAFDPLLDRVVLFSGRDADFGFHSDTWTLNNTAWSSVATPPVTGTPPARDRAAAAFDPARGRVVLFGGRDENFTPLNDTWTFTGSAWVPLSTPWAPPARASATLTHDPAANALVLVGGIDEQGQVLDDTWILTPANGWQSVVAPPAANLGPRAAHGAAFDPARGGIVTTGGFDGALGRRDTWLLAPGLDVFVTAQPLGFSGLPGQTVTLTLGATSTRAISFAWERDGAVLANGPQADGSIISGADTATLTITNAARSDSGRYRATASTTCTATRSLPVQVSIVGNDLPVITGDPASVTACRSGTASFTATVTSAAPGPVTYQWQAAFPGIDPPEFFDIFFDGEFFGPDGVVAIVSGGTTDTLTVSAPPTGFPGNAGPILLTRVVATNIDGSATSAAAALSVCAADFNCDGSLNDDDLGEFITAYFEIFAGPGGFAVAPCPEAEPPFDTEGFRADITADCSLNDDDLGLFVTLFFAGCE